ncbi:MAG: hypothetical protein AAGH90_02185 [Pseudomonadota bacterium]
MRLNTLIIGGAMALSLGGCMSIPKDMSVADYCANPNKANENVCRLKVEIDGNATAIADTNMSLGEARRFAANAMSAAESAQATADRALGAAGGAQSTADRALTLGQSAMLKEEDLICNTRVVQKSSVGTCEPGYTVMGCTQTRYTHRAGGLSFLREVNNDQCRFNSQVLEMHVRCCMTAPVQKRISYPVR